MQWLLDTWHICSFIIKSISFHHGIHVHLPTILNLQTIPDLHHEIQMDRSRWSFMSVVFFSLRFPSMDSIEIWLFCVWSLVSQRFLQNWYNFQRWPDHHRQSSFWDKFHTSILVQSQRNHFMQIQIQWNKSRVWVLFSNKCLHATFLCLYQWKFLGIFHLSYHTQLHAFHLYGGRLCTCIQESLWHECFSICQKRSKQRNAKKNF